LLTGEVLSEINLLFSPEIESENCLVALSARSGDLAAKHQTLDRFQSVVLLPQPASGESRVSLPSQTGHNQAGILDRHFAPSGNNRVLKLAPEFAVAELNVLAAVGGLGAE
jgi:hypothetical protein